MIEEDALIAILEGFMERLNDVSGVDPVESVRIKYHSPTDEVLDFAFYRPQNRSVNIAAELVEKAAEEGGRWADLAKQAAYHEWGHALTQLIEANVTDAPNVSMELHPREMTGEYDIDNLMTVHEDLERSQLVDAVKNLHNAGFFEYSDLDIPMGDTIHNAEDFVSHIERYGTVDQPDGPNDPLGHSLGDSIGENLAGVGQRGLKSGITELANELGIVSSAGIALEDDEHMRRLREMADVPDATLVRLTYPDRDSEGERVLVEREDGPTYMMPPKEHIQLGMNGDRIFEGSMVTIPNKAQQDGGTFQSQVLEVEPESGSRISSDTAVEWVEE